MGIVSASVQSLELKGYEVVVDHQGDTITILAEGEGVSESYGPGPLAGVAGWVNERPSLVKAEEPMMDVDTWDQMYGDITDEDVAAALADQMAPPAQEEVRALVPVPPDGEVTKVQGLTAWMLKQKQIALEQTRARLAFMRQAEVVEPEKVPTPPVETSPVNIRGQLIDAQCRRKWAFVEFEDRFGIKTTRAMLVYGVTPSYALAFCEMRFNELYPAFMTQFLETWMPDKGYGFAGNKPCRSKQAVKEWARREATRLFLLTGFHSVHILEDRVVPPPIKPDQWMVPIDDETAKRAKRPTFATNPDKYIKGGNYVRYSDFLAIGQRKEKDNS